MRFDTMPWDKDYDAEAHRAECQRMYATNKLKGQMANDAGHLMEKQIETAAEEYLLNGIARYIFRNTQSRISSGAYTRPGGASYSRRNTLTPPGYASRR